MYIVAFFNCLSLLSCLAQMDYVFGTTHIQLVMFDIVMKMCVRAAPCRQIDTIYERHSLCEAFFELNSDRIVCMCAICADQFFQISSILELKAYFTSVFSGILLFQKLNQFISNYRIALDLDIHF